MPFYIRKAISVGPIRFNLSKSGIGVSVGIKGLRLGSGARGNYIHAGRGGLYYRAAIPGSPIPTAKLFRSPSGQSGPQALEPALPAVATPLTDEIEYESGTALKMVDTGAEDLLHQLNVKRQHSDWWPAFIVATVVIVGGLVISGVGAIIWLPIAVAGTLISFWRYERDQVDRFVVSMYELDADREAKYRSLFSAFERLSESWVWHIDAEASSTDGKRDGGASSKVKRARVLPRIGTGPTVLRTNVPVAQIPVGRQTLHLLPDRILVEAPEGFGAVKYSDLELVVTQDKFLELGDLPHDAKVIGTSWKYKNKDGSPDLRFKDNRQVPIALYERIHFKSASGLNEVVQVSQIGRGEELRQALIALK